MTVALSTVSRIEDSDETYAVINELEITKKKIPSIATVPSETGDDPEPPQLMQIMSSGWPER